MIRVVVTEDHPGVRQAVRRLIELEPDMEVVGEAANGEQCLELVASAAPDAITLDLVMPGRTGLDVLQALQQQPNAPAVVVYSMFNVPAYVRRSQSLGALGYVLKDDRTEALVAALRDAVRGRPHISEGVTHG